MTAASGPISIAQEVLRTTLAATPAFRTWTKADDEAAALKRIHHFDLPTPQAGVGGEYTLGELEALRPFALCGTADQQGFRYGLSAVGAGFEFSGSGRLDLLLVQSAPHGVLEPTAEADRLFKNTVGNILNGMCDLAGLGGYLAFTSIALERGPWWPDSTQIVAQGLWQAAALSLDWGAI
jgi:hypothetical protein